MSDFFFLIFNAALINNLALSYLVGIDLQVSASRRMDTAWMTGIGTTCCLVVILPIIYLVNHIIIIPLELLYLDLLIYVMLIIATVYALKNQGTKLFPLHAEKINALVPVLVMNSILLAVILIHQDQTTSFFGALFSGLVTGLGFLFLLLVLTCLRERLDNQNIPEAFRGTPIILIALGLFSMGLMGLAGL